MLSQIPFWLYAFFSRLTAKNNEYNGFMNARIFYLLLNLGAMGLSGQGFSAEQAAERQLISVVRAYEKPTGAFHALIQLRAGRLGGRNPDAGGHPCEIWTNNKTVYVQALDMLANNHPVEVTYSGRGDDDNACQLGHFTVPITDPIVLASEFNSATMELTTSADYIMALDAGFDINQAKIGRFDDGSFIIVWAQSEEDEDATEILARRFTHQMYPDGQIFSVNAAELAIGEKVSSPNVVVMNNGNYAVTWNHWDADNNPTAYYRVFDDESNEVKAEKTLPTRIMQSMEMVALQDGGFAVLGLANTETKLDVFNSQGNTVHRAWIGAISGPTLEHSKFTQLSNGHLAISYGRSSASQDSWLLKIYDYQSASFISAYVTHGGELSTSLVKGSEILALEDGKSVVLYASGTNLFMQFFDESGAKLGERKQVNAGDYYLSDMAMTQLADGSFFVSWVDDAESDSSGSSVWGRRLDANGDPLTQDALLNRAYEGDQFAPEVVQSKNGPVFAFWTSTYSSRESVNYTRVGVNQITTRPNSYTTVGKVVTPNSETEGLTYALIDDAEGRFIIFSNDGVVKVKNRDLIDVDDATEHTIRVQISDGDTATEHDLTIQVVPTP
ncbi:MAG: hypothetical protein OXE99_02785 [Cellvibrionales bacterium]|nr:hypothetical protein [Cellvibrionales bacterium]